MVDGFNKFISKSPAFSASQKKEASSGSPITLLPSPSPSDNTTSTPSPVIDTSDKNDEITDIIDLGEKQSGATNFYIEYRTPMGTVEYMPTSDPSNAMKTGLPGEFMSIRKGGPQGDVLTTRTFNKEGQAVEYRFENKTLGPTIREQYKATGQIPEGFDILPDVSGLTPEQATIAQEFFSGNDYVNTKGKLKDIFYREYIGDISHEKAISEQNKLFNEWVDTHSLFVYNTLNPSTETENLTLAEQGRQAFQNASLGEQIAIVGSGVALNLFNPGFGAAVMEGKGGDYVAEQLGSTIEMSKSGKAWDAWINVASPGFTIAGTMALGYTTNISLGYVKGLGSTGEQVSSGISKGLALYTVDTAYTEGKKAANEGSLLEYGISQSMNLAAFMVGGSSAFKEGELLGFRKQVIAYSETPQEKARISTLFKGMDYARKLKSNPKPFDVESVLGTKQSVRFAGAMEQTKAVGIKTVLAGSGATSTYLEKGVPRGVHDIDLLVEPKTELGWSGIKKTSQTDVVKEIMSDYGVNLENIDIHDTNKPNVPLGTRGVGFTGRYVKTADNNFGIRYQMSFSELGLRAFGEGMFMPKHSLRGKDWLRGIAIAEQEFPSEYTETLKGYKPGLKEGTLELERLPNVDVSKIPVKDFTLFEKGIRRYGKGLAVEDIWSDKSFIEKNETFYKAKPFRPQLIEKEYAPDWARGQTFYSSLIPLSYETGKYGLDKPILSFVNYEPINKSNLNTFNYPSNETITNYNLNVPYQKNITMDELNLSSSEPYPKEPEINYPQNTYPEINHPSSIPSGKPKISSPIIIYPKYEPDKDETPIAPSFSFEPPDSVGRKPIKKKPSLGGFNVFVKDRTYVHGKRRYRERFTRINRNPLTEQDAMSLMGTALNESAAATGYIKPTQGKPKRLPFRVDSWNSLEHMFYQNKDNRFVENTEFRINTPGEIRGISAKGWMSQKQRSRSKTKTGRRVHRKSNDMLMDMLIG